MRMFDRVPYGPQYFSAGLSLHRMADGMTLTYSGIGLGDSFMGCSMSWRNGSFHSSPKPFDSVPWSVWLNIGANGASRFSGRGLP